MPYKFYKSKDPNNHFDNMEHLTQLDDNVTLEDFIEAVNAFARAIFRFRGEIGIIEDEEE